MVIANWKGKILAESDRCIVVEGNQYFPSDSVRWEFFKPSDHSTVCGWKGTANYYDVEVDGQRNPNAAWYYADPKQAANNIRGFVAFWKGVQITIQPKAAV